LVVRHHPEPAVPGRPGDRAVLPQLLPANVGLSRELGRMVIEVDDRSGRVHTAGRRSAVAWTLTSHPAARRRRAAAVASSWGTWAKGSYRKWRMAFRWVIFSISCSDR